MFVFGVLGCLCVLVSSRLGLYEFASLWVWVSVLLCVCVFAALCVYVHVIKCAYDHVSKSHMYVSK